MPVRRPTRPQQRVTLSAAAVSSSSVAAPHQVVQRHLIEIRQLHRQLQGQRSQAPLVFGIQGLVTQQGGGHLLLGQVRVLPQITNSQFHGITKRMIAKVLSSPLLLGLSVLFLPRTCMRKRTRQPPVPAIKSAFGGASRHLSCAERPAANVQRKTIPWEMGCVSTAHPKDWLSGRRAIPLHFFCPCPEGMRRVATRNFHLK